MQMSDADIKVLRHLRRYWYQRTAQIRSAVSLSDKDASVTRARLRKLAGLGLVRRHDPKMIDPISGQAAPIWVLTVKGSNWLAASTGDCALLLTSEPTFSDWMSLNHYCWAGGQHWKLDQAFAGQRHVKLHSLRFEHEVVGPGPKTEERLFLYEVVQAEPRIVCMPDTAMETELEGIPASRRAWYSEYETGADGSPVRIAAKKHKGYHGLFSQRIWKKHFPKAQDARVIAWCPNPGWMQALRSAMKDKPGAEFWLFCVSKEVGSEFLHKPLLYSVDKGPFPFAPPPPAPAAVGGADGPPGALSEGKP